MFFKIWCNHHHRQKGFENSIVICGLQIWNKVSNIDSYLLAAFVKQGTEFRFSFIDREVKTLIPNFDFYLLWAMLKRDPQDTKFRFSVLVQKIKITYVHFFCHERHRGLSVMFLEIMSNIFPWDVCLFTIDLTQLLIFTLLYIILSDYYFVVQY